MRVIFVLLAAVVLCMWIGFELRPRYPQIATVLFTVAVLLSVLGLGAFFGLY